MTSKCDWWGIKMLIHIHIKLNIHAYFYIQSPGLPEILAAFYKTSYEPDDRVRPQNKQ